MSKDETITDLQEQITELEQENYYLREHLSMNELTISDLEDQLGDLLDEQS